MDRQSQNQNQNQNPCQCDVVERVLNMRLNAMEQHIKDIGTDVDQVRRDMDGHVGELWEHIHKAIEEVNKSLRTFDTQILARVPTWALTVMTIGSSIIGAMATYILNHPR